MWFFYSIIAGSLFTISRVIERHILKGQKDSWAYSFWFSFIGALVSLPFILFSPKIPALKDNGMYYWILMLLIGLMLTVHNLMSFKSINYLGPSLHSAITKFRILWVFLFGIIFLNEIFTLNKFAGGVLTLTAGILILGKFRSRDNFKGLSLAFFPTILYASIITLYSVLFKEFNSPSLTFFIFFIPALLNLAIMPGSPKRVLRFLKMHPVFVFTAGIVAGLGNLAMNEAFNIGEQSRVVIIMEVFAIALVASEFFILKEKEKPYTKIIALTIAVIGGILVKIG